MPASGQTAAESLITQWFVEEGDPVKRGDILFEIETDKATMGVESFAAGVVLKICHKAGDSVIAGSVVAVVGKEEEAPSLPEESDDEYLPIVKDEWTAAKDESPPPAGTSPTHADSQPTAPHLPVGAALASPKARKTAREHGVDIAALYAKQLRPVKAEDILGSITAKSFAEGPAHSPAPYTLLPLGAMRRTIARNMLGSVQSAPQFHLSVATDMKKLAAVRAQLNVKLIPDKIKLSVNDLLIKALCCAVKKVPLINASYSDDGIRLYHHVNVGVATAVEDGLLVPVIHNVGSLSLKALAQKSAELISLAKSGKLSLDQMKGGTITISNLGMHGTDRFTAILNPPESAILAVGRIIDTPVGRDGRVTLRPMMDITATFDHRVVDGAAGARFMTCLRELIETPPLMLLD